MNASGSAARLRPRATVLGRFLRGGRGLAAALFLSAIVPLASCQGCRAPQPTQPEGAADSPTFRVYVVSDLAGALEPCGCVKDQLGGLDHFAAWVQSERKRVPTDLVLAAGPLFFLDPELKPERAAQDVAKAETLAKAFAGLKLTAFAPGANDFAASKEKLKTFGEMSGAALLFANAKGDSPFAKSTIVERAGVRIGVIGVAAPEGMDVAPSIDAVKSEAASLKQKGAQVTLALAAVGRGEAKRIADAVPDLAAIIVGSRGGRGEANTETPGGERVGNVVIAETGNHLTTAVALDFYVRGGQLGSFADGSALEREGKRRELSQRTAELRGKIADWERDGKVEKKDIAARKEELARLEAERVELDRNPPPAVGSFFRYSIKEVRDSLGKDDGVTQAMLAYYKNVNESNRKEFASRKPAPPPAGEASFIGVEACTKCHAEARKVWDGTAHAHAYVTLSKEFKEFNLDCVSCHVTGYDQPGGSTVTFVDKLKDVQCEVCHGPGSKHADAPTKVILPTPKPAACLTCHHPPHVHAFNAAEKMNAILGPGHGQ